MLHALVFDYNIFVIVYFLAINTVYFALNLISLIEVRRQSTFSQYGRETFKSSFAQPISVLVPAYNEELSIVQSVRGLLLLEYPQYEVVVVNDGSKDGTLHALIEAFQLSTIPYSGIERLQTEPIKGVYKSSTYPNLTVVDKENGGKADALNVAINVSKYPLVCAIDADSILEPDALAKVAWPFLHDPDRMIVSGGSVRIANDGDVDSGRIVKVRVPRKWKVRFQVVEYLRAFLLGRLGWSALGLLLIVSGAFGVFQKEAVIRVGGYLKGSLGEDMELIVRLHRHFRQRRLPYRIQFVPDPVCWTEAPEDFTTFRKQRNRWHRGLIDTLRIHRGMFLNVRYGGIGLIAIPYFVFFELLGPVVELVGYVCVPLSYAFGYVNVEFFTLFISVAVLYGILLSFSAVLIEEISFHRYERVRDLFWLFAASVFENLGFRQLTTVWRTRAFFDYLRGNSAWGDMQRKGFHNDNSTSSTMNM